MSVCVCLEKERHEACLKVVEISQLSGSVAVDLLTEGGMSEVREGL